MTEASLPHAAGGAPSRGVLRRLPRRKLALFGLVVIAVVVGGATFAPWLAPYPPEEQLFKGLTLEGAPMPPGQGFLMGTDLLGRDLSAGSSMARGPR